MMESFHLYLTKTNILSSDKKRILVFQLDNVCDNVTIFQWIYFYKSKVEPETCTIEYLSLKSLSRNSAKKIEFDWECANCHVFPCHVTLVYKRFFVLKTNEV